MPRTDPSDVMERLIRWSEQNGWVWYRSGILVDHLDPISEVFDLLHHEILDLVGDASIPLLAFIREDFFTAGFDDVDVGSVIGDYLKQRGWREDVQGKRYLEALESSTPTLYEICDLEPGRAIVIRDLLMGGARPATVANSGMLDDVERGDCFAGRLLDVGGEPRLTMGMLQFPREVADVACTTIHALAEQRMKPGDREAMRLTEKDADAVAMQRELPFSQATSRTLTTFWLVNALTAILSDMPRLQNSDGEEIRFSDIIFPLRADPAEVAAVLDRVDAFEKEDEEFWTWKNPNPPMPEEAEEDAEEEPMHLRGEMSLGGIGLDPGGLVLSVNSKERAERGRNLLASRLGRLAGSPRTRRRDPIRTFRESLRPRDG